jgi:hypothetical protein
MRNLSVGIWGPPLWSFLHGVGSLATQNDAELVQRMIDSLSALLPCTLCSQDYPHALLSVIESRKQTAGEACVAGELAAFMFDLHGAVNTKLATQQYNKLKSLLAGHLPEVPTAAMVKLLEPSINLHTVERRGKLFSRCPWNVEALWILSLLLCERTTSMAAGADYLAFLHCLASFLERLPMSADCLRAGARMHIAQRVLAKRLAEGAEADMHDAIGRVMRCTYSGELSAESSAALVHHLDLAVSRPASSPQRNR